MVVHSFNRRDSVSDTFVARMFITVWSNLRLQNARVYLIASLSGFCIVNFEGEGGLLTLFLFD
jgi:hypothetical protein